jgi:uncharacterized membrane protein
MMFTMCTHMSSQLFARTCSSDDVDQSRFVSLLNVCAICLMGYICLQLRVAIVKRCVGNRYGPS